MKNDIKVRRVQHQLLQEELAAKLGVSRQTVNAVETGRYDPSLPLPFKLAALFGARIEDIFQTENGSGGE